MRKVKAIDPLSLTVSVEAGDVVSYRTCGGGGYGPPEERDPARVLRDVLESKVSGERARDVYRVAVSGREVDEAATRQLRAPSPASSTTISRCWSRRNACG